MKFAFLIQTSLAMVMLACSWNSSLAQTSAETRPALPPTMAVSAAPEPLAGLVFECTDPHALSQLRRDLDAYLLATGVPPEWLHYRALPESRGIAVQLRTELAARSTLELMEDPVFDLREEHYFLPGAGQQHQDVLTVSKKEILLALLHPGRTTVFGPRQCGIELLEDTVGLRQNIVAWTERTEWHWPEGQAARWNQAYWSHGDLLRPRALRAAVLDTFLNPNRYSIGCYTATKLVMLQAFLDYYGRVKPNPQKFKRLLQVLWKDGDPLVHIEPQDMWSMFETPGSSAIDRTPGKLVKLLSGVPADNFVPGDWVYMLNTDPQSSTKTGYEGSNTLYQGRGRFDDYYNDNNHYYSFRDKLQEVYQWRHGVFSRSRDGAKIQPLSVNEIRLLAQDPEHGGILMNYRVVPTLLE